jgi:hypothetical protein
VIKTHIINWPTLEDRLKHPLTSRGEALRQMKNNGDILTPLAEKELDKYMNEEILTEEEKEIVLEFASIYKKHKKLGALKLAELTKMVFIMMECAEKL